jgi:hypothetical protein
MVEDHGHTLVVVEVHTRPLAVVAEVHGLPLVVAAEVQEVATGLCFSAGAETSFLIELPVFIKHIDSSDP